jgi:hypothetical protein
MILNFLSNKINLILMVCFGYILLGYVMDMNNILFSQQVLMLVIMFIVHFIVHLLGVSRGIFIATVHKKELNDFMKILDEHEQSGEPIDFDEIDSIIEKEFEEK